MDWDDMLSLMTLGAVLPYVAEAAAHWCRTRSDNRHSSGASAPG